MAVLTVTPISALTVYSARVVTLSLMMTSDMGCAYLVLGQNYGIAVAEWSAIYHFYSISQP